MPKHDEPITAEDDIARSAKASIGLGGGFRVFEFSDVDKDAVRATMPCANDKLDDWTNAVERALDAYIKGSASIPAVRARMGRMLKAVKPLYDFLERRVTADKELDEEVLAFIEAIDAEGNEYRARHFREAMIHRAGGFKFDAAIADLTHALDRGLKAMEPNGRDPDLAFSRLANSLGGYWRNYTGANPTRSHNKGSFGDHVRVAIEALPRTLVVRPGVERTVTRPGVDAMVRKAVASLE